MKNDKTTLQTRPGDMSAHELASSPLPEGTSEWQSSVSADYPEGAAPGSSQTAAAAGASATILRRGKHVEVLSFSSSEHDDGLFRTWLDARDGAVRVMVASSGAVYVFRLGFLQNGTPIPPFGEAA